MRTLTLARMGRALLLAAAVIMLPQLASAQLPVSTKKLTLQDSDASAGVSLEAAGTTTTSYTLTLPAAVGGQGAFLYAADGTGTLAWSDVTGIQDGWYPRWETTGGGSIVWTDPASADNPNWSLTGNALTAAGSLGTTTDQAVNFITGASGPNVRMSIAADGNISIATDATDGGDVTIGNDNAVTINSATTTINATAGATSINATSGAGAVAIGNTATATMDLKAVATTIAGTSLGITAATTQTGDFNLVGELQMNAQPGTTGDVLVSKGDGNTPAWESITDAVGIRKKGRQAIADGATSVTVSVADITLTDVITFSVEGTTSGAAIFGVITGRDETADTFTVTLSGAFVGAGFLNYLVQTP